jgi:hypothetical protein
MQKNRAWGQADPDTDAESSTVRPQYTSGDLPEEEQTRTADTGRSEQAEDVRVAGTPSEHDDVVVPTASVADEGRATTDDVVTELPPAAADKEADRIEQLIQPAEAGAFKDRWQEVQSDFVDDPHEAVRRANELAAEVLNSLTNALNDQKRALDDRWRDDKDEMSDTERLRQAVRDYRGFFNRMLGA